MTSAPRLNYFLFILFTFLCLLVGIAALIWPPVRNISYAPLRDALLPDFYLNPQASQSVHLIVAAPPVLTDWVRSSAQEFSAQNPLISVEVVPLRGADASQRLTAMTGSPDVWIAESDWNRVAAGGIPYETSGTVVAQDIFVWAAPVNPRSDLPSTLGWLALAQTAAANPQFRLGVPPTGSVEGMGACLSAAGEYFQTNSVTATQINDGSFRNWLKGLLEAVPDLTRNPMDQITSRPPQVDAAFLTGSDWHSMNPNDFLFRASARNVVLNYSFFTRSAWKDISTEEAALRRAAAEKFLLFLIGSKEQTALTTYGLTQAKTDLSVRVQPADASAVYAMQFCWRNQGGAS
jgi:hypothetical protein